MNTQHTRARWRMKYSRTSHAEHVEYWRARARELVTVNEARRAEKKPSKQIRIEPEELLELLAPWSERIFGTRPPP